ncbi:hypothetical protein EDC04DRAFT_2585593, partial [Pisolithus marmoratus]
DPLVHHGHHFGHVVHAFCNVQMLLTNGITLIGDVEERGLDSYLRVSTFLSSHFGAWTLMTLRERREYSAYQELLKIVPNLEECVMTSSEEAVKTIAELIQNGASGARADNTKSMKAAIIDWITLKGQTLIPHIPRNVKTGQGFHHKCTGALLCPTGYEWENAEYILLPMLFSYDPWNGLLHSGLLVSTCFALTSTQAFSQTDLVMDSEQFCNSILELLEDPDETDEVDQLMGWWNQQIFPLYTESEQLPSNNSILARIRQK